MHEHIAFDFSAELIPVTINQRLPAWIFEQY